ncbi:helicase associated domain-containing protein [Prevotella sp. P6B4]|uniref:helicase associated domain-containing protein n=1 Tax=Prevotella sp. P6B4 TaxID=1410614 RepID=UPI00350E52DC
MTQDERWLVRYNEVKEFIEREHRNPSKYRLEEHDHLNWLKANRKAMNAGKMKPERVEKLTIVDFRHDSTMIKRAYHCARCSESLENFWK